MYDISLTDQFNNFASFDTVTYIVSVWLEVRID